jgi:hypothetical protein
VGCILDSAKLWVFKITRASAFFVHGLKPVVLPHSMSSKGLLERSEGLIVESEQTSAYTLVLNV